MSSGWASTICTAAAWESFKPSRLASFAGRVAGCSVRCERVGLAGKGGKCGSNLLDVGADVGGGGVCVAIVGVACVRAGDGVAEVSFYPRQCGVPEPVGADLLGGDPGQRFTNADPQVVVSACGDWSPVGVAQ